MKSAKKIALLLRLSIKNIYTNRSIYGPYIFAGAFAIFTFFVLSSIFYNDLVDELPHSVYVYGMMMVGLFLLGIIMIPFLFYTHSFLLKQRKKEFALYGILGLGKSHVMLMLLFESILVYLMVMVLGILTGALLSKFLFLILLNLSGMPTQIAFEFKGKAFLQSGVFFLGLYGFIYIVSLRSILSSTPIHLLKGHRQNDHKPKHPVIRGFVGMVIMAGGYVIAVLSQVDSSIFLDFFLAVLMVIIGTYMLFKSGLHLLLEGLRKRKKLYYKSKNFITLSGIHQRINKSSASLANICIFSTMVIITLVCTVALFRGMESIHAFRYPIDASVTYDDGVYPQSSKRDTAPMMKEIDRLKDEHKIERVEVTDYSFWQKRTYVNEDFFGLVRWIVKDDAIKLNDQVKELKPGQVMTFSSGPNIGFEELKFGERMYPVQKELTSMKNIPKSTKNVFSDEVYIIVNDENQAMEMIERSKEDASAYFKNHYDIEVKGETSNEAFVESLYAWVTKEEDVTISFSNAYEGAREVRAMSGGLLFLGLFCSVIFMVCFIIVMYYKQLAEGYDDRYNFDILQKVGMDQDEVRGTILRQILVVFAIPLVFAVIHTFVGLEMVITLFATLGLYDDGLIRWSGIAVAMGYCLVYVYIYFRTSKTYYRIVSND